MHSSSFDFVVGTDNNVIKGICSASQSFANVTPLSDMKPTVELTRLVWADESDCIYFGRNDGSIGRMSFKQPNFEVLPEKLDSSICGLEVVDKKNLVVCTKNGSVNMYQPSKSKLEKVDISPGENLSAARLFKPASNRLLMATGGQGNDLKLFDLLAPSSSENKKEALFCAKNLPNDWLSLQQAVWIRDLGFIDQDQDQDLPKMVTVTDTGFLRIYDPKTQRRPVVNVSLVEHPLVSVAVFPRNSSPGPLPLIAAGSAQGWLGIVDLRQPKAAVGKPLPGNCITRHQVSGRCRGVTGSIRTLACLPRSNGHPLLVAGGLDRFVRVFDTSQPKNGPMAKIYTKSKLSCLAVNPKLDTVKLFEALSLIDNSPAPSRKRPKIENDEGDGDNDQDNQLPDLVIGSEDDEDSEDEDEEQSEDEESDGSDSVEYCGSVDLDEDVDAKKGKGQNRTNNKPVKRKIGRR